MPPSPPHQTRASHLALWLTRPTTSVFSGGVVGSAARIGVGNLLPVTTADFPVGTLLVNLTGSLLLGFFLARRARAVSGPWAAQFWGIGVFGSYTTFSAFSLDVVHLIDHERLLAAGGYVVASVLGGLLLALVGQRIGETLP